MSNFPDSVLQRLRDTKVVAGFSVERVEHAVPIANALLDGGIDVVELTLRTAAGMDAVHAVAEHVPDLVLGVGTILTPPQAAAVKAAGAHFGVSPGMNAAVVRAAKDAGLPFAPGVATPSDLEAAIELGCRFVKLFPAAALGGTAYLKSFAAPYAHLGIEYFPLGGVNASNLGEWLKEPNVPAVGGSWVVKQELVDAGDWAGITARAADARLAAQSS